MVAVGLGILIPIISLASFVFFIIVLIKQFSKGGVLQGLLGLITFGLWTFIWGWIKHRQFNLTKLMMIWSACYVISIAIFAFAGATLFTGIAGLMGQTTGGLKAEVQKQAPRKPIARNRVNQPKVSTGNQATQPAQQLPQGVDGGIDSDKLAAAAMSLWQNGRYADPEGAVDTWTKIISARPDSAEAYNNRGVGHYNARRYLEAISDYDQAIRIKANYAVAFNNRGNARYAMAKYQEALADYTASLRIDPQYANAHSNRGLAHYRINELSQACGEFQKACELDDCEMMKWAMSIGACK